MSNPKRPCRVSNFQMEVLDDEIILFHPTSKAIFYSNNTGALIWELCDGKRTMVDITQILSEAYPEAKDQIAADVHHTLETFASHGAIIWAKDDD